MSRLFPHLQYTGVRPFNNDTLHFGFESDLYVHCKEHLIIHNLIYVALYSIHADQCKEKVFKWAVSPNFSITVKNKKCMCMKIINGPALLNCLFYRIGTVNKCVWLRMAMMKMASNLKSSGRFFQVFALVSQIKSVNTDFG